MKEYLTHQIKIVMNEIIHWPESQKCMGCPHAGLLNAMPYTEVTYDLSQAFVCLIEHGKSKPCEVKQKPIIYIEIQGGDITHVYSTEKSALSIFNHDLAAKDLKYLPQYFSDKNDWDDIIQAGLNSGGLVELIKNAGDTSEP